MSRLPLYLKSLKSLPQVKIGSKLKSKLSSNFVINYKTNSGVNSCEKDIFQYGLGEEERERELGAVELPTHLPPISVLELTLMDLIVIKLSLTFTKRNQDSGWWGDGGENRGMVQYQDGPYNWS